MWGNQHYLCRESIRDFFIVAVSHIHPGEDDSLTVSPGKPDGDSISSVLSALSPSLYRLTLRNVKQSGILRYEYCWIISPSRPPFPLTSFSPRIMVLIQLALNIVYWTVCWTTWLTTTVSHLFILSVGSRTLLSPYVIFLLLFWLSTLHESNTNYDIPQALEVHVSARGKRHPLPFSSRCHTFEIFT